MIACPSPPIIRCLAGFTIATSFSYSEIVVASVAPSGPNTLREAIATATVGETISFDPGLSGETILLGGSELVLEKDVTIDGSGLERAITIDGEETSRIFRISSEAQVSMRFLILENGHSKIIEGVRDGSDGGAIMTHGNLSLEKIFFHANRAGDGVSFPNSSFTGGNGGDGGAIFNTGDLAISQCTFSVHRSGSGGSGFKPGLPGKGGAIYNLGSTQINFSTFFSSSIETTNANLEINNSICDLGTSGFTGDHNYIPPSGQNTRAIMSALKWNFCPIPVHIPYPNSPVIDAANTNHSFTLDQRGRSRVLGDAADIGAVEFDADFDGESFYEMWAARTISPEKDRSFDADPNGNGFTNGMEYVFGASLEKNMTPSFFPPTAIRDKHTEQCEISVNFRGPYEPVTEEFEIAVEEFDPITKSWAQIGTTLPNWPGATTSPYLRKASNDWTFELISRAQKQKAVIRTVIRPIE